MYKTCQAEIYSTSVMEKALIRRRVIHLKWLITRTILAGIEQNHTWIPEEKLLWECVEKQTVTLAPVPVSSGCVT